MSKTNNLETVKEVAEPQLYNEYWQDLSFEASLVKTHQVELEQAIRFGKLEGKEEAQKEIARQLLKSEVANDIVAQATKLTIDQIKKLIE